MAKTAEEKQKWLDALIREREQRESGCLRLALGCHRGWWGAPLPGEVCMEGSRSLAEESFVGRGPL